MQLPKNTGQTRWNDLEQATQNKVIDLLNSGSIVIDGHKHQIMAINADPEFHMMTNEEIYLRFFRADGIRLFRRHSPGDELVFYRHPEP